MRHRPGYTRGMGQEQEDYADRDLPLRMTAERSEELFALAVVTLGPLVVLSLSLLLLAYLLGV